MIITPQELQQWIDDSKTFTAVDIRLEDQRKEFPLAGLNSVIADADSLPVPENNSVLICQFGIVTEGIILERELENTFSLLGGVQAWDEFQSEEKDLSRWSRQTVLPEIGLEGQKKLLKATVAIVGMGGLGCPAAQSLVSAGVGTLKIIDGDKVELSNMHRQPLFSMDDVGKSKVSVAKERLEIMNRESIIETEYSFLNEKNGSHFLSGADVVIDATDNIEARLLIDQCSSNLQIPMIYGGLYRYEGQVAVLNVNGSAGYNDLFPDPPSGGESCADAGVLGMLPGIIGNIQALEALKLIVSIEPNLVGKLLIYDSMNHSTQTIEL